MENYYLGGYYLIKLSPVDLFTGQPQIYQTCSGCINQYAFDYWCLSTSQPDEKSIQVLDLTPEKIVHIKKWSGEKYKQGFIKWGDNFSDLTTAKSFKNTFFPESPDIHIYAIYLSETDANSLSSYFQTEPHNKGDFSLYHTLAERVVEETDPREVFIGYDFIGVDIDGSFHSFYCHGIGNELERLFSLSINENGLFDSVKQPELIRQYLNSPEAAVEPVPWYIAKVKRIDDQ
ncbi:hypothetical protein GCM10028805_47730 [Spirosoma harenae]